MVDKLGIPRLVRLIEQHSSSKYLYACGVLLQHVFNALAAMDRQKEIKPDLEISESLPIIFLGYHFLF